MSDDIARLGLSVESQGVEAADKRLDDLAASATRAERATDALATSSKRMDTATGGLASSMQGGSGAISRMAEAIRAQEAAELAAYKATEQLKNSVQGLGGATTQAVSGLGAFDTHILAYRKSLEGATRTAAQHRAGVQQLGYQLNDFGTQVATADDRLDSLTESAKRAERATDALAASGSRMNTATGQMNRAMMDAQRQLRATQQAGLGLTRQFSDIGVSIASGMPVWMVAVQQGSQLQDQLALMEQQGIKTGAAMRSAAEGFKPLLASGGRLLGILAPLALAWASFDHQVSKGVPDDVTRGLGLTADQLKRVEDRTVTMGDRFMATMDVIGKHIVDGPLGGAIDWLVAAWNRGLDATARGTAEEIANIIAFFGAGFETVTATWGRFKVVFADIIITGANAALRGIEWFVNKSIDGLNKLLPVLKGIAAVNPAFGWANAIDEINHVSFEPFENAAAGAAGSMGDVFTEAFVRIRGEARAGMRALVDEIRDASVARATARALEQAGDPRSSADGGKSDLERSIEETLRYIAALKDQAATYGMSAIAAKEYEIAQRALKAPTAELRAEVERYGAALIDKMKIEAVGLDQMRDQQRLIEREIALIGASTREREVELAVLAKIQEMRGLGLDESMPQWADGIRGAQDLARATMDLVQAQAAYSDKLTLTLDLARQLDDHARAAGQGLADAFGSAGDAMGRLLTAMTGFGARMEAIADAQRRYVDEVGAANVNAERMAGFDRERTQAQLQNYGDLAGAAKGLFAEQTAGYKVLQAAEGAFRLYQFAMSAKAVIVKGAEYALGIAGATTEAGAVVAAETTKTAATLTGTAIRTPAKAAEGAASMFAALGPFGFAAVAAMAVVLASFGFRGGGSSVATLPTFNTGAGTTLGDPNAPSESLAHSLEMAERYQRDDLLVSRAMLTSLKAIQSNITSLTTAIAQEMDIGGGLDTSGLGLGSTTTRSLFGLLSTTRTSELAGQGIIINPTTLGAAIANGISGRLFQLIQNTKTKSGFLGFGGGTTTWVTETTSPMSEELRQQLTAILASLREGVLTAAGVLGIEGAEATLDALRISIGRIDFSGMTSSEISQRLMQVFSSVGDQMAEALLPQLKQFQQAGEGLFETLVRLATEVQTVNASLASIGMSLNLTGIAGIEARDRLVQLAGGLDAFVDQVDFFSQNFLTEAQRIAPIQAAVTAELERLGLATDLTREQFANLVMGLDVSTEAGAAMFAALMALAPAMDQVLSYQEGLAGGTRDVMTASEIAQRQREMEIELLRAQGRDLEALAAQREMERATINEALLPLQEAIWAAEDLARAQAEQAEAARQAAELARQYRGLEIDLMEAQGQAAEALAARRAMELEQLDPTLRALQEQVWAAQDAASAQESLARAQEEAARIAQQIADQRGRLEIDLLNAQGRTTEALAQQRQLELAAMDQSLRSLQELVWTTQDAANAQAELARQQEEAARQAEELARTRRDLEIQLLEATGDATGALAARRADELAALDPLLRALQQQVWAAQDAAASASQLAQAQEEAARQARQIADQRRALEISLMEATGNATGALAARRADELAAMDESLRALQSQVWAAQDAAAAHERLAQAHDEARRAAEQHRQELLQVAQDARGVLADAYQREAGGIQSVIDKFGGFSETLRAFRDSLGAESGGMTYAQALADFNRTASLARLGDEAALGSFQDVAKTYLDAAKANAGSATDYALAVARVRAQAGLAADTADRQKSLAEQQLDQLKDQVRGLIDLNENVVSVHDAIVDLRLAMKAAGITAFASGGAFTNGIVQSPTAFNMGLMGEAGPEAIVPLHMGPDGLGVRMSGSNDNAELVSEVRALRAEVAGLRAENSAENRAIVKNTKETARVLDDWDGNGMPAERAA